MMKMVRAFVIGVSAFGLAATPAFAQQQPPQQDQQEQQRRAALVAADTLRGAEVRDRQGQNIGSIEDIMVDPQTGRIQRVVISPGMGRDSIEAAWANIDVKRDGQQLVVTMDRPAAGADPAASPRTDLQRQQQPPQQALVKADDIEGAEVRDAQNQRLGTADRLMIDPERGEVAYVVVATGGFLGIGRDHVQMPWQNLQVRVDNDDVVLVAERPMLEQAPDADRGWIRDRAPAASPAQPGQPQQPQQQRR